VSLLNSFKNKEVGVTTIKKIKPITIGEIIFPSNIPNLNHKIFNGFNILELSIPKIKKIIDIIKDQILISPFFKIGHKATSKNTIKKTIPKLLLLPI
tara:strand:+ start:2889 stop:3179 length:291 start_codon:yes stop_codon:yes gene_type:complete